MKLRRTDGLHFLQLTLFGKTALLELSSSYHFNMKLTSSFSSVRVCSSFVSLKIAEDVFVLFQMSKNWKLTLESDKFNYVNGEHGFVNYMNKECSMCLQPRSAFINLNIIFFLPLHHNDLWKMGRKIVCPIWFEKVILLD